MVISPSVPRFSFIIIAIITLHYVDPLLSFADSNIGGHILADVVKDLPNTVADLACNLDRASSLSSVLDP